MKIINSKKYENKYLNFFYNILKLYLINQKLFYIKNDKNYHYKLYFAINN